MSIPDLFQKWNIKCNGLIHIGAHECEERQIYANAGLNDTEVIWIEGNPSIYEKVKNNLPSVQIYQGLISDKEEEVDFIITNNFQSSSFLELKEHLMEHPHVFELDRIRLTTTTLPNFCEKNNIDVSKYDFLVMDIQGAELHALKGMSNLLNNFKHVFLEVNTKELYAGCGLLPEIIEYLKLYGFEMRDIIMTQHGWGDAYFSKN